MHGGARITNQWGNTRGPKQPESSPFRLSLHIKEGCNRHEGGGDFDEERVPEGKCGQDTGEKKWNLVWERRGWEKKGKLLEGVPR